MEGGGAQAPALAAHLMGIALTSPDLPKIAGFYSDVLGYEGIWQGDAWRGTLCGRTLEFREGPGNSIDHAMFAVAERADLAALRERLTMAGTPFEEVDIAGLEGAFRFADQDGNRLMFGVSNSTDPRSAGASGGALLQHVVYATDDIRPQIDFYCGVVGFAASDLVFDDAGDLTSAFLRCGVEHHSLAIFRAPSKRLDHFCYEVDDWSDIRDWADRFAERHITLRWGPGRHGPGNNLFLFINDPDGNWLEFSAELERVEDPRPVKHWAHEERTLNSWGGAHMRS